MKAEQFNIKLYQFITLNGYYLKIYQITLQRWGNNLMQQEKEIAYPFCFEGSSNLKTDVSFTTCLKAQIEKKVKINELARRKSRKY